MVAKNKKSKKSTGSKSATSTAANVEPPKLPENFSNVVYDMCNDLSTTFPEYAEQWQKYSKTYQETLDEDMKTVEMQALFDYCLAVYPERFFDILYKNQDIFTDSNINTNFLPNVDFSKLFNCEGVSETTKNVMWNYLQLILFTILGSVQDKAHFGESKSIFDGIDENDLFSKLTETMENMTDFFQNMESSFTTSSSTTDNSSDPSSADTDDLGKSEKETVEDSDTENDEDENESKEKGWKSPFGKMPKFPDIKELHQHLKTLFDGKIGSLAKELAEEITGDLSNLFGQDVKDMKSTKDILQVLMKDPKKISGIVQKITEKLKNKMSSGEISQEELMKEATDLLGKMKDMGGGMDQFKDMFKNMGIPIPKNAKIDMNALNRMTSQQSLRERLKKRMMAKKQAQMDAIQKMAATLQSTQAGGDAAGNLDDILKLSAQLGLNLDSNEGIDGNGTKTKTKSGKKK